MSRYLEKIPVTDVAAAEIHSLASFAASNIRPLHDYVVGEDVESAIYRRTNTHANDVHWYGAHGDQNASRWRRASWENAMVLGVSKSRLLEHAEDTAAARSAPPYEIARARPAIAYAVGNAVVAARLPSSRLEPPAPELAEDYDDYAKIAMLIGRYRLRNAVGAHVSPNSFVSIDPQAVKIIEPRIPRAKLSSEYPDAMLV